MIGIILLAAGASARMGTPKQLLKYKGSTLLQLVLDTATAAGGKVVVVLGAYAETIQQQLNRRMAQVVENTNWQQGMSSSIRCGLEALLKSDPAMEAVIILVGDQPYISADLLQKLIAKWAVTGKKIVASTYNGTRGVPALFDTTFFPALLSLNGQEGAKKLVQQYPEEVATVDFPGGAIDIDTVEDYEMLRDKKEKE